MSFTRINLQRDNMLCDDEGGKDIGAVEVIQRADLYQDVIHVHVKRVRLGEQFLQAAFLQDIIF